MKTRNGDDIMGKIHLEGADNARDLGGLKTTEGAVIREKKLIFCQMNIIYIKS